MANEVKDTIGARQAKKRNFNLTTLEGAKCPVVPTSETSWTQLSYGIPRRYGYFGRDRYDEKDIKDIIENGDVLAQQKLSRYFYERSPLYRQQIIHYASILKYVGILIPHSKSGSLSTPNIKKRYERGLEFVEHFNLPKYGFEWSEKALVDGCYYGVIQDITKDSISILDLPMRYCVSRFKDPNGNDLIEFDVSYFDTIADEDSREIALDTYPQLIANHYRAWSRRKSVSNKWVMIPADIGICFPILSNGLPFFLPILPSILQYEDTVEIERERDLEEIRKIIVQKIPHNTSTNELLFEPDEALEMHEGTVAMMGGNKNVSVLTTYADVDAIVSKTSSEASSNSIEKMLQNVFNKSGVSPQLFASTGSTTLKMSIRKDIAFMMTMANKYATFLTGILNKLFGNSNISFKYEILPVGEQNWDDYIKSAKELASLGYSWLVPSIAQGISQRDLSDIKQLENDVLKLPENLIPLQSAYNAIAGEVGAPKKQEEEKAEQTIKNEKSLDNTAGGSVS